MRACGDSGATAKHMLSELQSVAMDVGVMKSSVNRLILGVISTQEDGELRSPNPSVWTSLESELNSRNEVLSRSVYSDVYFYCLPWFVRLRIRFR